MISIKSLKDTVDDLLDKNNARISTGEEFTRLVNISQLELFDECIGATNKLLNNQTLVAYGRSQNTDRRLEPFRTDGVLAVVDGEVSLPTDCEKITGVFTSKSRPKALIRVDEDRLGMLFDNPLRSPNEDDVYYMEQGGNSLMILGAIDTIYITYLRKPTPALYNEVSTHITVGSRTVTRMVFDQDTSVDLEWNERETMDLVNRLLDKLSIPTRDVFVSQKAQINKTNE